MAKSKAQFGDLVGRERELSRVRACLAASRSVLLEGPVGVGKTRLAISATQEAKKKVFRIDGDSRYSEQKLTGWFDPPAVMKKGFKKDAFIAGPLIEAMEAGGILFINELNRLPEGVQNVLLPAIDERMVSIPKLGIIKAKPGFLVIATQNPKEFVATSHLSEAILDRFELIAIDYQTEDEEFEIVRERLNAFGAKKNLKELALASVRLTRTTRDHPRIKRGASIRAGIAVAELTSVFISEGYSLKDAFFEAVLLALPTRIEIEREAESNVSLQEEIEALLRELSDSTLENLDTADLQKKN